MGLALFWTALAGLAPTCAVTSAAGAEGTTSLVRGYPFVLSADTRGGVWYGGAESGNGAFEDVDRVDYITPGGTFTDFPFIPELWGYWPESFTSAPQGQEWFLARRESDPVPLLVEVSPLGTMSVHHLSVASGSRVRGLTIGPEGDLWMTEVRTAHGMKVGAILRVTPAGEVTSFREGLQEGALPDNITAGPGNAMWFTDLVGRIGRIYADGRIKEFPIRHAIEPGGFLGPPNPIIAGPDEYLWFIVDAHELGRMSQTGRVRVFTPHYAFHLPASLRPAYNSLIGLASGPEGDIWFTRELGEVARIDRRGRESTVTAGLVAAHGIAFGSAGAWIGESARYSYHYGELEEPARVAHISASGTLTQYPPPPPCRVPNVVGYGPYHAAEEIRGSGCELGGLVRPPHNHSNHLIVVHQSVHRGAVVPYKTPVRLRLGRRPRTPRACRAPRYTRTYVSNPGLVVWMDPKREADNGGQFGGPFGSQRYFACVRPRGAKRLLFTEEEEPSEYDTLQMLHAAGHFVAFTDFGLNHYNNGAEALQLFDVARGRQVFQKVYPYSVEAEPSSARIATFAVNGYGELAWVKKARNKSGTEVDTLEVHERNGARAVETAADISKLAFHGHVLTWNAADQARSRSLR